MRVEPASERHLPAIAAIYDEAARTTHVTFDLEGRPVDAWRETLAASDELAGRILLVAVDEREQVLGAAWSGRHKPRRAYDITCETSVYVAASGRGRGVGGALYDELLRRLDGSALRLAIAGVALPNDHSVKLHVSRGYEEVGTYRDTGWKLGRTWDVMWLQRRLAVPALVEELSGLDADAMSAAMSRAVGADVRLVADTPAGGVPVIDPDSHRTVGSIAVDGPLSDGRRLLLQWCSEVARPLFEG
jgi:phosphinothricin acetyltransferase